MNVAPSLSLAQKQQLKLSPQLLQSFELMTLPLSELQQRIKAEVESNPAFDIPGGPDMSYEHVAETTRQTERKQVDDSYSDSASYGSDRMGGGYDNEAADRQQKFMENALSREETLQDHLVEQLRYERLSPEAHEAGLVLITNLDANGFFQTNPEDLLRDEQKPLLPTLLALLHTFDPVGIGVGSWRESILVQAEAKGLAEEDKEPFRSLVYDHLEKMRANKQDQVAKTLGISTDHLEELFSLLRSLTPYPGQAFPSGPETYVAPDLWIHKVDGDLVMKMNDMALPDLHINGEFASLAEEKSHTPEGKKAQAYIQQQLRSANELIFQIQIRNQTLFRVGQLLLDLQKEFFLKGPQYLKPLTQKTVAEQLGVHETTISRISTAKWIDTDWGILPLKNLFSTAVGNEGHEKSKQAVKEMIRQIIEGYSGTKALSDRKIADMLAQKGISVARRTVAKYRNELNIDPSFIRGTN